MLKGEKIPAEWEDRDSRDGAGTDEALLTREEREMQGVRRAEDEERHGHQGVGLDGLIRSKWCWWRQ
jgi:hypothetical protein